MARWLLPENLADVLPRQAAAVEGARRDLLDLFRSYGYELVMPPLLEHLDSLLTGTGGELGLHTFQLVDQLSGRMLGVRADTTPQVARIDSHILDREGVSRLCYAGPVVHARPLHPLASREPLQVGAELYGEPGLLADAEILELAVLSARRLGLERVQVDLGHSALVRILLAESGAPAGEVLDALRSRDPGALDRALGARSGAGVEGLRAILSLHGGTEVIERAGRALPDLPGVSAALRDLAALAQGCGADEVGVDLADPHGFRYHSGATFAVWVPGQPGPLLRGGRYDDIGAAFGRARPATGFSILDLRDAVPWARCAPVGAIRAPLAGDARLAGLVRSLREQGEIVVRLAPGDGSAEGSGLRLDREIVESGGAWVVRECAAGGAGSGQRGAS